MASLVAGGDALKRSVETERVFTQLGEIVPLAQKTPGDPLRGLIVLGDKPLQLVLSPLPDKDLLLMVGRYLDQNEINRITALTEFVLDLVPVSVLRPFNASFSGMAAGSGPKPNPE